MKKERILLIILFLLISKIGFSQENPNEMRGNSSETTSRNSKSEKLDTIKLFQNAWMYGEDPTVQKKSSLDTLIDAFQQYNPLVRNCFANSFNGNLGLGGLPLFFHSLPQRTEFFFNTAFDAYILTPEKVKYFNTTKPYTVFNYSSATRKRDEQSLSVIHSQNINREWNVGLIYKGLNSNGEFTQQKTKCNSVGIFTSFEGFKYSVHASFTRNKFVIDENGGIIADSTIAQKNNNNLPPNLLSASSYLLNRSYHVVQNYTLKRSMKLDSGVVAKPSPSVTISHIFDYSLSSTIYKDKFESPSTFYKNFYYSKTATLDSVAYSNVTNSIQLKFNEDWNEKFKIGMRFMLTNEIRHYYNFRMFLISLNDSSLTNYSATASLFNNKGKRWNWSAVAKYYFQGYNQGDFKLWADLTKSFVTKYDSATVGIYGSISKTSPSYFENKFFSNHFQWTNSFLDQQELFLQLRLEKPAWKFSIKATYSITDNYIYFGEQFMPEQSTKPLSVLSFELKKDLKLGFFHIDNKVLYQSISNKSVLHLPDLCINSTWYAQFFAFKAFTGQIGFDVFYYSKYYMPTYLPATKQFNLQSDKEFNDLPFVDFFFNMKIKRAILFFKFENLNSSVYGKNYFTVSEYPLNSTAFKFGVSWRFFD